MIGRRTGVMWLSVVVVAGAIGCIGGGVCRAAEELRVGFAAEDITPDLQAKKGVWLAGYGQGRRAKDVHDPIMARGVVLQAGERKIALVCVDLVGLQYPAVRAIREQLKDFTYVMVSSSHNHEGPDVIGLWGPNAFTSGVDDDYLRLVVERTVRLVRSAEKAAAPAVAEYGAADDASLLGDSRLPKVYDGVLRAIRFRRPSDKSVLGLVVQWNCHPESMGSRNKSLTADFPWATVAALTKKYNAPVAYFSGAVGGLMAPPDDRIKDASGKFVNEGDFEYCRLYGEAVAELVGRALDKAEPITLTPLAVSAKPVYVPLDNPLYKLARGMGVLRREARHWAGDGEKAGSITEAKTAADDARFAVESEVGYIRLGELHVACIPGELYPELVYGQFQEPAEPNADFPDAPLESPVMKTLPGKKTLLIGLANDELGYIIPKRQWDDAAPYAYGRSSKQYGEINSCGPEVAPILMRALERRVKEFK